MDSMIQDTAKVIDSLLAESMSLRDLSMQLYGTTAKAGLLADVCSCRSGHVSFNALQDLRQRLALRYQQRHVIDLYADEDAAVHLLPGGQGRVTVHHVPDGATVVIVPPGARVIQQSARKDRRNRWRPDLTEIRDEIEAAGMTLEDIKRILVQCARL